MSQLTLRSVSKHFGNHEIIPPLDLTIEEGSFLVLLGPSGCGKTTLLRMIAGLETPSSGEILIDSECVYRSDLKKPGHPAVNVPPEKRNLGMVFQSYAVWPHYTVFENVAYPLRVRKSERVHPEEVQTRVRAALELVGIAALESRMPEQLSGGQQQRVALARALVSQPRLLLLDEPLSNLDAKLRAQMRRELKALHQELSAKLDPQLEPEMGRKMSQKMSQKMRMTAILVTHDQREAEELATEVVLLDRGRIIQKGAFETLKTQPETEFVREFLELPPGPMKP
jgi:ABC-type Fe3+/spermidine/putrescine transport system ATPase subunit